MPEFTLAKAFLELAVKGNLGAEIKRQKAGIDTLNKAMSSGALRRFAVEQTAITRTMEKLNKSVKFEFLKADKGTLGAYAIEAKDRIDALKASLEPFASAARKTFLASTGAMTAFVAAASPDMMNTFYLSLKLVAAELGMAFVPYVMQAVYWIQQFADWIHNLSAEQKASVASWLLIIAAVSALVMVLPTVVSGIRLIAVTLSTLSAHPILILAAGFAYLAYKIHEALLELEKFYEAQEHPIKNEAELRGSGVADEVEQMKAAGKTKEEINRRLMQVQQDAYKEQARMLEATTGVGRADLPRMDPNTLKDMVPEYQRRSMAAAKRAEAARMLMMEQHGEKPAFPKEKTEEKTDIAGSVFGKFQGVLDDLKKKFAGATGLPSAPGGHRGALGAAMGAAGLAGKDMTAKKRPLLAFEMRPQIMGIADAWKQAQVQVKDPLTSRLLEIQQEMLKFMMKWDPNLGGPDNQPIK